MSINLSNVGMENGQHYETIITTIDKNGKTNAAPFGVRCLDKDKILLRIFDGGNTIKNIKEKRKFIVNISANPMMFTLATTDTIPNQYLTKIKYKKEELIYLANADAYFICEVETLKKGIKKDDPISVTETNMIRSKVTELHVNNKNAKAINRGIHVLIESLVNYSRINMVDEDKQRYYLDRIKEAERIIKKVGSKEEKEAIKILKDSLRNQNYEI